MNFNEIINFFSDQNLLNFFFKAFAIVFSIIYVLFSIVIFKQTQVMTKTVQTDTAGLIVSVSLVQVFVGVGLLIFTILLL